MLVSTHNLGSVPEFCDRAVLINRTVLAAGPTEEVFTQANSRRPSAACCGISSSAAPSCTTTPTSGASRVLTDDERPLVIYGDGKRGAATERVGNERTAARDRALEPFTYDYMVNAMWVSALVGGVCAFLSAFLMLKGWSLIGDALSHAIVPGVAGAYIARPALRRRRLLPGRLAAAAMLFAQQRTKLKEDAVIGLIFTSFFGLGLFMVSLSPTSVNIQTIVLGNILAITPATRVQLVIISAVSLAILLVKWKDLMVVFFDENHARSIGLNPTALKVAVLHAARAPARWRRCRPSAPSSSSPWW